MKRNGFDSFTLLAAVVAGVLAPGGYAQDPGASGGVTFDPSLTLARAADTSADGEVDAEEWQAFLGGLGAGENGVVERRRLKSRLFFADLDGDGKMTARDLELMFERVSGSGGGRGGGWLAIFLPTLADADRNGTLTANEASAFVAAARPASAPDGPIEEALVIEWVARIEAEPPPTDRNALTPGVLLATLDAALDADSDGQLALADLGLLFGRLDANSDGRVDATELANRRRAQANGNAGNSERWEVTEEARARPPLMPWQRNLDDALAISRATGKPLLLCVNMDGESASDALAFGRYRDPAFAELVNGFVPLLASPDIHGKRERDDRGRRIPDERFGRLVDSEHVDIEPLLYEHYFAGNRVAPRHVGVAPDGKILFDVFLVQDLALIDAKLREFGVPAAPAPDPSTLSTDDLLASSDAGSRDALEGRFVASAEAERARLVRIALSPERATQHPELVRLALRDPSDVVRQAAWTAVVEDPRLAPIDAFPVLFARFGKDPELRTALVDAVRSLAEDSSDPARRDAAAFDQRVLSTLFERSVLIDRERWDLALAIAPISVEREPAAEEFDPLAALLDRFEAALGKAPEDAELLAGRAAAFLRLGRVRIATGQNPTYFLQDAIAACERALAHAPEDGRILGTQAFASWLSGDTLGAGKMAERALPYLVGDAGSPLAVHVLEIFAAARAREVYDAMGEKRAWPENAIPDACAAYELLLAHPGGTEKHVTAYLQFLGALSAFGEQARVVRAALTRFPLSPDLHSWLRYQVLRDAGARALEATYDEEPLASARTANAPSIDWFQGLATFAAAEQDVANRDPDAALAAYARMHEHFARSVEATPDFESSAAHYRCLAFAGEARLLARAGRLVEAVESITQALRIAPASLETADGLGQTPVDSARELHRSLVRAGESELASDVEASLTEAGLELSARGEDRSGG